MESFQSGGESNATFRLSKEHLARLTQPVDEPERSLWDRILYGQRGPPSAPPVGAAVGAADGAAAALAAVAAVPPPPAASPLAAQPLLGVVTRTTGRIFNREIAPWGDPKEPLLTVRRLNLIFPTALASSLIALDCT